MLGSFKAAYRQSDVLVDTHGELPDYLPMVLEYAARVDLEAGRGLLGRYRASLEMLRFGLLRDAAAARPDPAGRLRDPAGEVPRG